jgi:ligand-binding sensor domain-containing protein
MPARAAPRSKCVVLLGVIIAGALLATACGAAPTPTPPEAAAVPLDVSSVTYPVRAAPSLYDPHVSPPAGIRFEQISVEQGLSENSVYCTFQDSQGFLWFRTADGLNKYDGQGFTVYRPDPEHNSISFNYVQSVCESPQGVLWIGTEDGLYRQDSTGQQFTHYLHDPGDPRSLSNDSIRAIYEDREGVLWIGTGDGLDRFDHQQGVFDHYWHDPDDQDSLSHDSVQAIFEDREGVL